MSAMTLELDVDGLVRTVQLARDGGRFEVVLDGGRHVVDAVAIEPGRWSLLAENGRSHEIVVSGGQNGTLTVIIDGRSCPSRSATRAAGAAPRARTGLRMVRPASPPRCPARWCACSPRRDRRVARQGVIVAEAMKMENELRAPRAGTVGEVLVREGAPVEAGALLLTIE